MAKKYSAKEVKTIDSLIKKGADYKEIAKKTGMSEYLSKEAIKKWERGALESYAPPKILILDIETAPLEVYTWGLWDQQIGINQIKNDWFMLCWSAKWLFDDTTYGESVTPKESLKRDDKRISKSLWKLVDEADIVVAHNGDAFDVKKMNVRFIKNGLSIPSPYLTIDTLKVARKNFKMTSNKLDYLTRFLGFKGKIDTGGFELWEHSVKGDKVALALMLEYCINDVNILEDVYIKLRPYIKNHPNLNLYGEGEVCRNCGSEKIKWGKYYHTPNSKYKAGQCQDCGAWVRKENLKTSKIK